jgi:hypothetical protein
VAGFIVAGASRASIVTYHSSADISGCRYASVGAFASWNTTKPVSAPSSPSWGMTFAEPAVGYPSCSNSSSHDCSVLMLRNGITDSHRDRGGFTR